LKSFLNEALTDTDGRFFFDLALIAFGVILTSISFETSAFLSILSLS
jgi:hypothetical protein